MEIEALVIESLPNGRYKVEYQDKQYVCYLAGKVRQNKIGIMLGDRVRVTLDKYGGKDTNRITWRL